MFGYRKPLFQLSTYVAGAERARTRKSIKIEETITNAARNALLSDVTMEMGTNLLIDLRCLAMTIDYRVDKREQNTHISPIHDESKSK